MAGRKLFVGSLPDGIADITLRATFQQYGQIDDVYVKPNCEPGKQCAFVLFASPEQAQYAKECCDRVLAFPGASRPCEVMIARNQGMNGQQEPQPMASFAPVGPVSHARSTAGFGPAVGQDGLPKKIHVGSLPDGIADWQLREEFSKFGVVTEVHVKQGCEPGRQWAFVTFERHEEAILAKETTDRLLTFPGSVRPCEVVMARNQGMFGHPSTEAVAASAAVRAGASAVQSTYRAPPMVANESGPRKILVGSLPDGIHADTLRAAFEQYGRVVDIYVKPDCLPGRQWAFVSFATHEEAQQAKSGTDRVLVLSGSSRPCEVLFARGEGGTQAPQPAHASRGTASGGGSSDRSNCKIFVGSMPGHVSEQMLQAEFDRFGTIVDSYLKMDCEPGRQWGFVTFERPEEAAHAKESTDRALFFPGADRPCEVMIAKNQGGNETNSEATAHVPAVHMSQSPKPAAPEPFDVRATPWRLYYTKDGLPYYHNHVASVTQWERPHDLPPAYSAVHTQSGFAHHRSPY